MIILVRHGETAANAEQRLLGRLDPPLNERGRRQALGLAAAVGGSLATDAVVISSPLARARETAAAFGRPVAVDDRWIEIDYGTFDGMRLGDVPAELWQGWRRDAAHRPPEGESLVDVGERIRAALAEVATVAADRDVVVVSHVSPIKAAVAWALGVDDPRVAFRLHLATASVCRIVVGPGAAAPRLQAFNECHPEG